MKKPMWMLFEVYRMIKWISFLELVSAQRLLHDTESFVLLPGGTGEAVPTAGTCHNGNSCWLNVRDCEYASVPLLKKSQFPWSMVDHCIWFVCPLLRSQLFSLVSLPLFASTEHSSFFTPVHCKQPRGKGSHSQPGPSVSSPKSRYLVLLVSTCSRIPRGWCKLPVI